MFGISFLELGVIVLIALLVFGPERLPDMARKIGKISGDLRRTTNSIRREFYQAVYEPAKDDLAKAQREIGSLRTLMVDPAELDPNCPDTPARLEAAAKASAQLAATLAASPETPTATASGEPPSETPTSSIPSTSSSTSPQSQAETTSVIVKPTP